MGFLTFGVDLLACFIGLEDDGLTCSSSDVERSDCSCLNLSVRSLGSGGGGGDGDLN